MKRILLCFIALSAMSASAGPVNYCERYLSNQLNNFLMHSLAEKLGYTYEEFCVHPRILDVFQEDRRVYHKETDSWQDYRFVTIHYNEYSCEYRYNLNQSRWLGQHCYNTW
jgi:hypothetical protein